MFARSLEPVSELVTRGDLEQTTTQLRGEMKEMKEELRGEMKEMKEELLGAMGAMEARLDRHIGEALSHVASVMLEHVGRLISTVDEKYQDLLPAHAKLRDDFDTHAADLRLHMRQPAALAKRTRRPRSR